MGWFGMVNGTKHMLKKETQLPVASDRTHLDDVGTPECDSEKTKRARNGIWHVALLILLVVFVHRHLIIMENGHLRSLICWDLLDFTWPKLSYLTDCLRSGVWPLWDPYDFAGNPLVINLVTLYSNPLVLAYAFIVGFSVVKLQVFILILYAYGALNFYILARQCLVPVFYSISLALLYSVSGFALSNAQHGCLLLLFLTEPLTIALMLRFLQSRNVPDFCLAVIGTVFLMSGGYPSVLGHLMLFNCLYGTYIVFRSQEKRSEGFQLLVLMNATACVIMLPVFVPAIVSLPYITRGVGVSYEAYTSHSLSFPYLTGFLNPLLGIVYFRDTLDDISVRNCTIGLPVAMLLIYAVLRPRGKWFLILYFVVS
jgi:hypothetical protein